MHQNPQTHKHVPVLLAEIIQSTRPAPGERYLDVTAGYGGHAQAILSLTGNYAGSALVDRDPIAMEELHRQFAQHPEIRLINQDYLSAAQQLMKAELQFDIIVADLGVSSPHLNEVERGFSVLGSGPLDMRMDPRQEVTAWHIVNHSSETELADMLWRYGEEPKARQIARLIVRHRPLNTTQELAMLVSRVWPKGSHIHPATRSFQAIRIVVNDELGQLERALPVWLKLLATNGRLAVISFHSLEDRIVKRAFSDVAGDRYDADYKLLTKHPVIADTQEIAINPRARSAKLRVLQQK